MIWIKLAVALVVIMIGVYSIAAYPDNSFFIFMALAVLLVGLFGIPKKRRN